MGPTTIMIFLVQVCVLELIPQRIAIQARYQGAKPSCEVRILQPPRLEHGLTSDEVLDTHALWIVEFNMFSRVKSGSPSSNIMIHNYGKITGFVHVEFKCVRGSPSLKPECGMSGCHLIQSTYRGDSKRPHSKRTLEQDQNRGSQPWVSECNIERFRAG